MAERANTIVNEDKKEEFVGGRGVPERAEVFGYVGGVDRAIS